MLTSRKAGDLEEAMAHLQGKGIDARWVAADASDAAQVQHVCSETLQRLGPVDILVNNAGAAWAAPAEDHPLEAWEKVMSLNVRSVFLFSQVIGKACMLPRRRGRIINIASIAGEEGNPTLAPYSTAKAGVIGFTKALAKEVATHGILVNAIAPAVIGTDMVKQMSKETVDYLVAKIPMGRVGRPEEVAALVAWLVSDECTFSTGAVYDLSGGRATY